MSITIALLAVYYLFHVLRTKFAEWSFETIAQELFSNFKLLAIVLLLVPINWLFEVIKWKMMMGQFQQISVKKAIQSISFGITLSLVTPNRVGDFGGRLIYIDKAFRWQSLYYDTFLSITQLLVTLCLGLIGGSLYLKNTGILEAFSLEYVALIVVLILIGFYFLGNLNSRLSNYLFHKFKGKVQLTIDRKIRLEVLLLSVVRYLMFSTQFYLLLWIFDCSITSNIAFIGISTTYLITALVPTGWISDIAVRTSVAFYIFETLGHSGQAALIASCILWVFNLLLPALVGLFNLRGVNWLNLKQQLQGW